jgi:hypothetical protein
MYETKLRPKGHVTMSEKRMSREKLYKARLELDIVFISNSAEQKELEEEVLEFSYDYDGARVASLECVEEIAQLPDTWNPQDEAFGSENGITCEDFLNSTPNARKLASVLRTKGWEIDDKGLSDLAAALDEV